jgi:hypothetical protein
MSVESLPCRRSRAVFWKPNRWIAALLGLVAQWASMLYLMRPRLAAGYLLLNLVWTAVRIRVYSANT